MCAHCCVRLVCVIIHGEQHQLIENEREPTIHFHLKVNNRWHTPYVYRREEVSPMRHTLRRYDEKGTQFSDEMRKLVKQTAERNSAREREKNRAVFVNLSVDGYQINTRMKSIVLVRTPVG